MSKYKSMRGLTNEEKFKIICEIAWDKFQLSPLIGEKYKGVREYIDWVDIEGKMYRAVPENIKRKSLNESFTIFRDNPYTEHNLAMEAYKKFGLTMLDTIKYSGWDGYLHFIDKDGFKYNIPARDIYCTDSSHSFNYYKDNIFALYNANLVLKNIGLYILDNEFMGLCKKYNLVDIEHGYMYYVDISNTILKNRTPQNFGTRNPYTIHNIKIYSELTDGKCQLLSVNYKGINEEMKWVCGECDSKYFRDWGHQNKSIKNGTGGLCEECARKLGGLYYSKFNVINRIIEDKPNSYVYFIKMNSKKESFYKIGITSRDVNERISEIIIECGYKYNVEILYKYKTNLYNCIYIEDYLHDKFKDNSYNPNIKFGGHTECFLNLDKSDVAREISYFNS